MITAPLIFFYYELLIVINVIISWSYTKHLNKHHNEAAYKGVCTNIREIICLATEIKRDQIKS